MIIRRGFADVGDGQIHFRDAGAGGAPLVMLHASPGSSRQLETLIAERARTRRVIAPDTPGNGDSTAVAEAPAIEDLARALLAGLDALGPARRTLSPKRRARSRRSWSERWRDPLLASERSEEGIDDGSPAIRSIPARGDGHRDVRATTSPITSAAQ